MEIATRKETQRPTPGSAASLSDWPTSRSVRLMVEVPEVVVLIRGRLYWEPGTVRWQGVTVDPLNDLLFPFARLAKGTDEQILDFAKAYGILGICQHSLPRAHLRQEVGLALNDGPRTCPPSLTEARAGASESLEDWRRYADQMATVMVACDLVRHGKRPGPEAWATLADYFPEFAQPSEEYGASGQWPKRTYIPKLPTGQPIPLPIGGSFTTTKIWNQPQAALSHLLRRWLDLGGVKPTFKWTTDPNRDPATGRLLNEKVDLAAVNEYTGLRNDVALGLAGSSLFGTLVIQLLAAVAGTYRLRFCRNCTNVFAAKRNDQTYCHHPDCDKVRTNANRRRSHQSPPPPHTPPTSP